jgi:hypothetical protein
VGSEQESTSDADTLETEDLLSLKMVESIGDPAARAKLAADLLRSLLAGGALGSPAGAAAASWGAQHSEAENRKNAST